MEDKSVVIRVEPPIEATTPVPATGGGNFIKSGMTVRGSTLTRSSHNVFSIGTGPFYVLFTELVASYGDKFAHIVDEDFGLDGIATIFTQNNNFENMRIGGSFTVTWPSESGAYPMLGEARVLSDSGVFLGGQSFRAEGPPGAVSYVSSGSWGPHKIGSNGNWITLSIRGMPYDEYFYDDPSGLGPPEPVFSTDPNTYLYPRFNMGTCTLSAEWVGTDDGYDMGYGGPFSRFDSWV